MSSQDRVLFQGHLSKIKKAIYELSSKDISIVVKCNLKTKSILPKQDGQIPNSPHHCRRIRTR
jgi:hypothetical protein